MGAVVASQGDPLATYRLGNDMGRKMLRADAKMPHNPDLLSQLASDNAKGHVQDAAAG
jgi:hypothetical protein